MCADALVKNSKAFSVSRELRIAPANVIVPHGKPLLSYRYLAAPFNTKVWIALGTYVFLISGFLCLIHWLRSGKWDFSQNLLEVYSSLLFTVFHLKATNGIERYILFGVLFISGFVYSTSYLRLLKSMLIAETFEKQIQTFEELAESNIPLLINPYDRMIFQHHHIPKSLWTAQYLRHPKFRRIPIDICFLFAGFPMSKKWFLKDHLSRAWFHAFESGIVNKITWDAYRESVGQGYLNFSITEHLEAKLLGLYYFMMPTIFLALGYSDALLNFIMELEAVSKIHPQSGNVKNHPAA
uniref:HDC05837 n=1 Tax=Drosophila melanogaster TaxID=7227 RepID=Q6IGN5_DROME|nr:TPA_inf: HDC05837 [Drosophila melanogaster]